MVQELIAMVDVEHREAWRVGEVHELLMKASRKGARVLVGVAGTDECYEIVTGEIKRIEGQLLV